MLTIGALDCGVDVLFCASLFMLIVGFVFKVVKYIVVGLCDDVKL